MPVVSELVLVQAMPSLVYNRERINIKNGKRNDTQRRGLLLWPRECDGGRRTTMTMMMLIFDAAN